MLRGFKCGDGWFNLIDRLCYRVQFEVDPGRLHQPIVAQIKERLGGLRVYWRDASEFVRALSNFATDVSLLTCEACGGPAERSDLHRLKVRCLSHLAADADPGES